MELLVVILLLSIIVTFAAVKWEAFSRQGDETFVERFSVEVSKLREEAISKFEERILRFDITNNLILIGVEDEMRGFVAESEFELPEGYAIKDVVINGEKQTLGKPDVYFYPDGRVDRLILHLDRGKETFCSVMIHPLTAKVSSEDAYIEEISVPARNNAS